MEVAQQQKQETEGEEEGGQGGGRAVADVTGNSSGKEASLSQVKVIFMLFF